MDIESSMNAKSFQLLVQLLWSDNSTYKTYAADILIYFSTIEKYKNKIAKEAGFIFWEKLIDRMRRDKCNILPVINEDELQEEIEIGSGYFFSFYIFFIYFI